MRRSKQAVNSYIDTPPKKTGGILLRRGHPPFRLQHYPKKLRKLKLANKPKNTHMKTINGFNIKFDFSKLIKVAELIYFDGCASLDNKSLFIFIMNDKPCHTCQHGNKYTQQRPCQHIFRLLILRFAEAYNRLGCYKQSQCIISLQTYED